MTFAQTADKTLKIIYRYTTVLLLLFFVVVAISIYWYMERQQNELVRALTLNNAELYSEAITEFRTLYSSEVVARARQQGVLVTHDYEQHPGAIPLPATLSIILGQRIGQRGAGANIKLYSPHPYPWRQQSGGLRSEFSRSAWSHFQQNSSEPFYRFESSEHGDVLRFATADIMRASCVNCHNQHQDTPKSDWQTGDVRGVLEVVLPIKNVAEQASANLDELFWLISGISAVGLLVLLLLIGRLNFKYTQSQRKLENEVEQGQVTQIELMEFNEDLKNTLDTVQHMQTSMIEAETMAALGGMVAGIAHEINTPLGISITANSLLEEQIHRLLTCYRQGTLTKKLFEAYQQDTLESTNIMASNLSRAAELIKSFKQVAVDQTSHERRIFNLHDYLDDIVLAMKPQFKQTSHKIELDCPPSLIIDSYPGSISQIITNLINNSLKHGFEQIESGVITCSVQLNSKEIIFCYEDNGKGIPDSFLHKIYEPFFTTERQFGGSGLGMHLVYNIVTQLFKGNITCHSGVGKGVKFMVVLPLADTLKILE